MRFSRCRCADGDLVLFVYLVPQARVEAIARGEDPDAAEALILNGGVAPVAAIQKPEPIPQPQTTGLEGGGLGIEADVSRFARLDWCAHRIASVLVPLCIMWWRCVFVSHTHPHLHTLKYSVEVFARLLLVLTP